MKTCSGHALTSLCAFAVLSQRIKPDISPMNNGEQLNEHKVNLRTQLRSPAVHRYRMKYTKFGLNLKMLTDRAALYIQERLV